MHSIVGLIKTSSAMTIPNGFPDGPVLLGQRTLGYPWCLKDADGKRPGPKGSPIGAVIPQHPSTSSKDPPDGSGK